MKILRITTILLIIGSFLFKNAKGQTMLWDEYYAETIFIDSFSGSFLDENKWDVSVFKRDIGLLIDSSATLKVNNGNLELTMISCPNCKATAWNGITYYGNYAGAEVVSKVAPFQYGIFECHAKYAQMGGSWPAFWIIGGDGTPCPPGGYGNEIDIAEYFCKGTTNNLQHNIHHYHPPSNCENSIHHLVNTKNDAFNGNNDYHYFKCVWTPNKISYYVDGSLKHEVANTAQKCTETNQYWFPEFAMQLILSQQITQPYNILGQEIIPSYPQTTYFNFVSVKRFFATPEITCPGLICTTANASLDVDSLATNITWSLTPANLFTGNTTGSGKNVTITKASFNGQGTITYNFQMPSGETFSASKTFWMGPFSSSNYPISGPSSAQCNQYVYYSIPQLEDVSSINWVWPSSWTYISGQNTWSLALKTGNSGSGGIVGVQATNSCGPSGSYYTKYTAVNGICGYSLVLTPNPATTETTLSIESTNPEVVFDENQEWEMEVYDAFQTLKMKKEKLKGKEMKIQASGWKVGVYIVRVKYKEEVLTEQLVVKQ